MLSYACQPQTSQYSQTDQQPLPAFRCSDLMRHMSMVKSVQLAFLSCTAHTLANVSEVTAIAGRGPSRALSRLLVHLVPPRVPPATDLRSFRSRLAPGLAVMTVSRRDKRRLARCRPILRRSVSLSLSPAVRLPLSRRLAGNHSWRPETQRHDLAGASPPSLPPLLPHRPCCRFSPRRCIALLRAVQLASFRGTSACTPRVHLAHSRSSSLPSSPFAFVDEQPLQRTMSALPQTDYQRLQDSLDKIRSYGWTDTRLTAFANFVAQAVPSEWHMRILMPAARDRLFSTVATIYSSAAGVSSSRLVRFLPFLRQAALTRKVRSLK